MIGQSDLLLPTGEHTRVPPEGAIERLGQMLEAVAGHPYRVGATDIADGWFLETHTLGCRDAADTPEEQWWDEHWSIYDEYAADERSSIAGDPSTGVFGTLTPPREPTSD